MKDSLYKNYLLAALLLILAFNSVDRLALGLLLQNIKADLHLSDTQLGFLTGIAFALFYSVMGVPIARWADRGNRVAIISITTALWSAAVAMCAAAASFLQLLLIRVAVAVGEAGCMPPAHSLIADHFTRAERSRAMARYMLGAPLSVVIGYFLAGWLNEFYGWRTTFLVLGLPGLLIAALVWFTLNEPRRRRPAAAAAAGGSALSIAALAGEAVATPPSLLFVCTTLWANRTFRHLLLSYSVASFFSAGVMQWKPAFFIRSYGLQSGELGTWFAAIYAVCGLLGTYWGGELAFRHAAQNERLQLRAMAIAWANFGVISAFMYLSPNHYIAFALMALAVAGSAATIGPLFAVIQTLVPQRMRATAIAMIYLFANLIGMGLGPLAAGALSDALQPLFGEESLRYALLALTPGYVWSAWHLWHASKTVRRDLEQMGTEAERASAARDGAMSASV